MVCLIFTDDNEKVIHCNLIAHSRRPNRKLVFARFLTGFERFSLPTILARIFSLAWTFLWVNPEYLIDCGVKIWFRPTST